MTARRDNPSVVIIGAGMTGILMAIRMKQAGISNVTVLEKKESAGGTWRENTYPGVACDVPSHAYTYSFEPNPNWSSHFPAGREIHQYFKDVVSKYGVDSQIHFNEPATSCIYNDATQTWTVTTALGQYEADLLISATGILHHPNIPAFRGMESFAGACFHTARWDHSVELTGKRIGVIGTGSTAAQVIPELVNTAGTEVSVFQRTPQWTVSMEDHQFSDEEKQRFARSPWRMGLIRKMSAFVYSRGTAALTGDSWFDRLTHKIMAWNGRKTIENAVADPELRARLTPDYEFGCKRVVITSKFYDAIQQPNAHLVTDGIDCVEPEGIRTTDGKLHKLDIIVMATGFDPTAFMRPMEFLGSQGLSIEQAWEKKITAYRSMFLPHFPNFVLMLGPNSPIGNQSVIEISEIQANYLMQLVDDWRDGRLEAIEASEEATQRWAQLIKDKMKHTVWTSGCDSWYLDAEGDALTWPFTWNRWVKSMQSPDLQDFVRASPINATET